MVKFLESDPRKAAAWAGAQDIAVSEIASFVAGLTPVQLVNDTRVTNHGYSDGMPTPRQSVLQAGTAVLVDRYGVPRVRCACGNPLRTPARSPAVYGGQSWSDSDPSATPTTTVPPETTPPTLAPTLAPTATAPPATPAAPCGPCPPGYTEIGGACVDEFGNEPPGAGP